MALLKTDFDSNAVAQAEQVYSKAQLGADQRKLVENMAKVITKYVPINELAIRGFCMMAAVDWQKKNKKPMSSLMQGTPQERVGVAKELALELGLKLKQILHFKGKEKEDLVDEGIRKVIELYTQGVAKR